MNKKGVEFAIAKIVEILLFLIFFIVMLYLIWGWNNQGYGLLDRFLGLFR